MVWRLLAALTSRKIRVARTLAGADEAGSVVPSFINVRARRTPRPGFSLKEPMTKVNPYLWPAKVILTFCDARGKVYFSSTDRKLDFSDSLMNSCSCRTVYLGMTTSSPKWKAWTEESVQSIERLIRYDLQFDGFRVRLQRQDVPSRNRVCTQEFRWKLTIRPA